MERREWRKCARGGQAPAWMGRGASWGGPARLFTQADGEGRARQLTCPKIWLPQPSTAPSNGSLHDCTVFHFPFPFPFSFNSKSVSPQDISFFYSLFFYKSCSIIVKAEWSAPLPLHLTGLVPAVKQRASCQSWGEHALSI